MRYDLLVIGNDPAGCWGAVSAAKLSKRVAVVEPPRDALSELEQTAKETLPEILSDQLVAKGAQRENEATTSIPTPHFANSIESDRFRSHAIHRSATIAPSDLTADTDHSLESLRFRLRMHANLDRDVFRDLYRRYDVETFYGDARLIDAHTVLVDDDLRSYWLEAHRIAIATGSRPRRPERLPHDDQAIVDSHTFWEQNATPPGSAMVIGAGATGACHAALLASLGIPVRLIDGRSEPLADCDQSIRELLEVYRLTGKLVPDFGEEAIALEQLANGLIRAVLTTGRRVTSQLALLALERLGATGHLNLPAVGVSVDENGRLWCDGHFRTWASHIYGVGDVVGFPQTTLSAMDQGLRMVRHAFHTSRTRTTAIRRHLTEVRQSAFVGVPALAGQGAA